MNPFCSDRMKIVPVPCLEDNYAYLIIDEDTGEAAVVDPVEPQNILQVAEVHGAGCIIHNNNHKHGQSGEWRGCWLGLPMWLEEMLMRMGMGMVSSTLCCQNLVDRKKNT